MDVNLSLSSKVFENSLEGIYITDASGNIALVNKAFTRATGYSEADILGQRPAFLSSGWHDSFFSEHIKPKLLEGGYWEGELVNRRACGEVFPVWVAITQVSDDEGQLQGHITSFRDITDDKSSVARIRKLAYFDPLTDLPNRSLFHDRLLQALQRAQRKSHCFALLFLDLDGFKTINDTLGHAQGDILLKAVAARLEQCSRSDDTVARLGGDEFAIIVNSLPDKAAAESASVKVASKIMKVLSDPFELQCSERFISTSIGIALYPYDGDEKQILLKNADTAMYHAKNRGKNGYQFFTSEMNERMQARLRYQQQMQQAFINKEFESAFQPIYQFDPYYPVGVEVLLRWRHPEQGLIFPDRAMLELQDTTMLMQLGEESIQKACEQMAIWRAMHSTIESISVNIPALLFSDAHFVHMIIDALDTHNLAPKYLELELSEAVLMEDIGYSQSLLQDLKALGVRICIDDFGSGLSSLSVLKHLPIDRVKLDSRFIEHIPTSAQDYQIAESIVALAHSFGFNVIADGVNNQKQFDYCQQMQSDACQGVAVGLPMTGDEMLQLLKAQ